MSMRLRTGEVAAANWRPRSLVDLVRVVRDAAGTRASAEVVDRPMVVAIDGRGGAGKTHLAGQLQELASASAAIHTDDIAWNQSFFDWGDLLASEVLVPLRAGRPVSFRPPAWQEHGRPGSIEVPSGLEIVWVEGTGIIRRELAGLLDASIYVQGDLDVQEHRLAARDGQSRQTQEFVVAWLAKEVPFMAAEQPWAHADIVVDTTSPMPHAPDEVITGDPPPLRPR